MMRPQTKKWLLLVGLLVLSLVLAWQAPEPESTNTEIVQAKRQPVKNAEQVQLSQEQPVTSTLVATRQLQSVEVDIFNTPQMDFKPVARPITPPKTKVKPQPKRVRLPFKYIGKLDQANSTTLFLMNGTALHLVKKGEEVDGFKLIKIDQQKQQVQWLHLASKQTQKMSMKQ